MMTSSEGFAPPDRPLCLSSGFDFTGLQREWGKDGNFALVSGAVEVPTGNKDYSPFQGPFNFIGAGMLGFEPRPYFEIDERSRSLPQADFSALPSPQDG